jgi:hypothetical protein
MVEDALRAEGIDPNLPPVSEKCPHSHLHIGFLKKIGHAVEKVGAETVEAALTVALSGTGAFSED